MLGYRTGESPVVQVHLKIPKPFKWLRKLFRRFKFKHARFDDGKYTKGQRDVEKWQEDDPLAKADYPDHRWQSLTRSRKSRNRLKDTSSHCQMEIDKNRHRFFKSSNNHEKRDQNNILDMDLIKQVLEKDPGYIYGGDTYKLRSTIQAEVHNSRPSRIDKSKKQSKKIVGSASRTVEEKVRATVSGYSPLGNEDSPVHASNQIKSQHNFRRVEVEINTPYPARASKERLDTYHDSHVPHEPPQHHKKYSGHTPVMNSRQQTEKDIQDLAQLDITPCQHENENDLNHLKVFERKRFNKKPKDRRSRKKRQRRKGKYTELEKAASVESLDEPEVQVQEQFQSHILTRKGKPVKARRHKKKKTRDINGSLRRLIITFRNIPDAPVFHHKKYKGYTRLEE